MKATHKVPCQVLPNQNRQDFIVWPEGQTRGQRRTDGDSQTAKSVAEREGAWQQVCDKQIFENVNQKSFTFIWQSFYALLLIRTWEGKGREVGEAWQQG